MYGFQGLDEEYGFQGLGDEMLIASSIDTHLGGGRQLLPAALVMEMA